MNITDFMSWTSVSGKVGFQNLLMEVRFLTSWKFTDTLKVTLNK